jgi:hypothetical protein cresD4_02566
MDYYDKLAGLFEGPDSDLFKPAPKKHAITKDERLVSSFEQINEFVRKNNRTPNEQANDISEAMLGHMLNVIKVDKKKVEALAEYDEFGLFESEKPPESLEELFAEDSDLFKVSGDIFDVQKLPRQGVVDKNTGETASRKLVEDFSMYRSLFKEKQDGLSSGKYKLMKFTRQEEVVEGGYYISGGQMCYVESIGEEKLTFGRMKARLRVIFENGTESNIYLRTLSSQLYNDDGYIVVSASEERAIDDKEIVGHIYVLKSKSEDVRIQEIANLYKIGMTEDTVENRIVNAKKDPTYLMAPVEIVDTYKVTGDYKTQKVEALIHRFFADAKVTLTVIDKDSKEYSPNEWYSVPIGVIREAIDLLNTGDIINFVYDSEKQKIVEIE